jgi:hypothetical protein
MLRSALFSNGALTRRAAIAVTGTCSAGVASIALCEPAPAAVPSFVLGGEQYDQTTFKGRFT